MAVLLMRLVGPMQSWGTQGLFSIRDTGREPSKSGVIGLLCAALGRPRSEPVDDLAALRMGVRVDVEGKLLRDYHIAQNVLKADGRTVKESEPSTRYYLADAHFLVGLEGELALLEQLHNALRDPVWPLYLGRKAFVPAEPVWLRDGLRTEGSLKEELEAYPWLGREGMYPRPDPLRLVLEDEKGVEMRHDQPLSFRPLNRRFLPRRLRVTFIPAPQEVLKEV